MLNLPRVLCAAWIATLLVAPIAHAQKFGRMRTLSHKRPTLSTHLNRTLADYTRRNDIRLSVARMDHAVLLNTPMNKRPHSTAFLFTTRYKGAGAPPMKFSEGSPVVWAVTANHTAQVGEKLRLTFYDGEQAIPVDGTVVQQGPALLSDAALIKLDNPPLHRLRPLELSTEIDPKEKLTTLGYAFNTFYKINNLTFEKDNTRFIRTNFPETQSKRSGLCGGPLLNAQGKAVGIHCGTSFDDKSYASSVRIIPYLLKAYYEGNAQIPVIAKDIIFGSINIDERIFHIECRDDYGNLLNQEDVYDQLPQSLLLSLYQDPEVRYMRFMLGSYHQDVPSYRILVYDKKTGTSHFESPRFR